MLVYENSEHQLQHQPLKGDLNNRGFSLNDWREKYYANILPQKYVRAMWFNPSPTTLHDERIEARFTHQSNRIPLFIQTKLDGYINKIIPSLVSDRKSVKSSPNIIRIHFFPHKVQNLMSNRT